MIVVRRTFDFCSSFAENIDGGYALEAILRVHTLYVSSNNKKEKKKSTPVPPVLLHNAGSKVHGHNVRGIFLNYLPCCQT